MNTYEELIPIMYDIAKRYASHRHPVMDIVHDVWVLGRVQHVPMKFVSKRIQWDIIEILRDLDGARNPNTRNAKFRARNPLCFGKIEGSSYLDKGMELVDNKDWLDWVIKCLNRGEKLVIVLHYVENMTMNIVGKVLGVSESRASQIHKKAIEKIRRCHEMSEN